MRTGKFIIGILLLCCFIRMVIGEPCTVPSGSMEPTLLCGDRLWINKLAYGGRFPSRWADIPLLNVFTWIRPLRLADEENHWEYRRFFDNQQIRLLIALPNTDKISLSKSGFS